MASRRFFGYDPYEYYYPASFHYPSPYYHYHHQQPAPGRSAGGFFPAAGDADQYYGYQHEPSPASRAGRFFPTVGDVDPYYQPAPARSAGGYFPADAPEARATARPKPGAARSVSIPVRFAEFDPEPEVVARVPVKRRPSAEEAATRLQAAARGFLARHAVRALRAVEREAEEIGERIACEAEALRGDARARVAAGEELMRLLLRLDAVRGAREYRRRVAKRVLALQDAVDALEQRPAAAAVEATEDGSSAVVEMAVAEESAAATELPGGAENNGEVEESTASETTAEMEVDGDTAAADEAEPEPAPEGANLSGDMPAAGEDAEGEWEMVADEPAAAVPAAPQAPQLTGEAATRRPEAAGGADGMDMKKLMEMVAALCEQSAQQCAVIGALAERVDALERSVRRVEDAERRRRRAKKLRKEGKGSNHIRCYSD